MNFRSDNEAPVNAQIMEAINAANTGFEESYGYDSYTLELQQTMQNLFGCWCDVIPLTTGTSANSLAMALSTPAYGALVCYESAHMITDECGAPEFYSGGAKLIGMAGEYGKIDIPLLEHFLAGTGVHGEHESLVSAISLTQSTEAGTLYSIDEIRQIKAIKEKYGLSLHMDGSRIANAVAATGEDIAQMTWKSGVDLLSFGATKNGAMMAEALIVFNPKLGKEIKRLRKRAGQLISKMRFVSSQLLAYLHDDLWLDLASHANQQAQMLYQTLKLTHEFIYPVQANEVFMRLDSNKITQLQQQGFAFHVWPGSDDIIRLVFSHATQSKHVEQLIQALKKP